MSSKMNPTNPRRRRRLPATLTLIALTLFLVVFLLPGAGAQRRKTIGEEKVSLPPTILPIGNACCGKKPPLKSVPNYATTYGTFTGQVAIVTGWGDAPGKPALTIIDLKNQNQVGVPLGNAWTTGPPTNYYSHSLWTKAYLGDVFGLTLDNIGNIFVATTRVYGTANLGSNSITPGSPGAGDIYKIDANTGNVTRFVQTVAANHYTSGNKIPSTGPSLGNIHYSCSYDKFYVSNFEDGDIYRIDAAGTILSRWDHGQNLSTPIADSQTNGFTALGRRTWAVQVYNGRMYYSVWWEDIYRPSGHDNEIWSVGLNAAGDFVGAAQLEISVPPLVAGGAVSSPVSDISFTSAGKMLLAERTMTADASSYAHSSRLLEYTFSTGIWVPSLPTKFSIGTYGTQTNSAGGVDFDNGPNGRVWGTGDAIHFTSGDYIYGIQGTPVGGGTQANSILIDLDNDTQSGDKTYIGDVEIPCYECNGPPKPVISGPDTTCGPGTYCTKTASGVTYSWNVTGGTVQQTPTGCIKVTWGGPGTPKTITVTATDASGCTSTTTLTLKDCDVLHQGDCCTEFKGTAELKSLIHKGNGVYDFTATVTSSNPNIIRVTADIISTSLTYSAPTCGTAGPVNGYVLSAANAGTLTGSVPVANGHEAIWYGAATTINGVSFPMQIKFPPPPVGHCRDYLTFCVKYTFTDKFCKTCEVIVCYGPFQRGGIIKINDDIKSMTLDQSVAP